MDNPNINELLDLAKMIDTERQHYEKAIQLWTRTARGTSEFDELTEMIEDDGKIQVQRAKEMRDMSATAPLEVAKILNLAAVKMLGGTGGREEVVKLLSEAAATWEVGRIKLPSTRLTGTDEMILKIIDQFGHVESQTDLLDKLSAAEEIADIGTVKPRLAELKANGTLVPWKGVRGYMRPA